MGESAGNRASDKTDPGLVRGLLVEHTGVLADNGTDSTSATTRKLPP